MSPDIPCSRVIRVRREADEVMHPSCLVPTVVQACGGSAMIWGCCSWSCLGSLTLCAQIWGQLTIWIYWMTRLFHQWIFSSLMAQGFSKMTTPRFTRLKLWKSGSGCMRHHGLDWASQSPDLNPIENLWDVLENTLCTLCPTLPSSLQDLGEKFMQLCTEMNYGTLQKLIKTMPQRMRAVIRAKGSPTKY